MTLTPSSLLDNLRQTREREQARPAAERRDALMKAVRAALDGLPDVAALEAIAGIRAVIAAPQAAAGGDGNRLARLEAEIAALQASLERERATGAQAAARAAELDREIARVTRAADGSGAAEERVRELEARIRELESRPQPAPGGAPPSTGSTEVIESLRRGIRETVDGKRPTAQSLGLPEEQARLFRFVQALVRFLLDLEQLRLGMLKEHEVGTAGGGTQMVRLLASQLKGRMRDVLDDKKGSLQALETTLRANQHFPLALDQAYREACSEAVLKLMEELKTDAILESNKRIFGYDYEAAWKEISKRLFDLSQMHAMEIWALYLKEPFQTRMNALKPGE